MADATSGPKRVDTGGNNIDRTAFYNNLGSQGITGDARQKIMDAADRSRLFEAGAVQRPAAQGGGIASLSEGEQQQAQTAAYDARDQSAGSKAWENVYASGVLSGTRFTGAPPGTAGGGGSTAAQSLDNAAYTPGYSAAPDVATSSATAAAAAAASTVQAALGRGDQAGAQRAYDDGQRIYLAKDNTRSQGDYDNQLKASGIATPALTSLHNNSQLYTSGLQATVPGGATFASAHDGRATVDAINNPSATPEQKNEAYQLGLRDYARYHPADPKDPGGTQKLQDNYNQELGRQPNVQPPAGGRGGTVDAINQLSVLNRANIIGGNVSFDATRDPVAGAARTLQQDQLSPADRRASWAAGLTAYMQQNGLRDRKDAAAKFRAALTDGYGGNVKPSNLSGLDENS